MVNQTSRDVLLQVLNIIGYSDNKEEFISKFLQLCEQQALINMINSLPEDRRSSLESALSKQNSPENITAILDKYLSKKDLAQAVQKATEDTFKSYLQSVIPTLSNSQRKDLDSLLKVTHQQILSKKQPPPA